MFSHGVVRSLSRSHGPLIWKAYGAAPVPAVTRQCIGTPPRSWTGSKRYISVYGYTQSKALVYSRYGEPKDVLR